MADSVNGQLIHLVEIMAALGRNPDNKSRWKWADFSSFRFFWFGSFNLRGPKRPAGARTGLAAAKRKAEKRTEIEKSAQQERQQSAHSPSCGNKKTASQTTTKQLAPNKKRLPSADWLHPLAAGHVTRNIFSKKKNSRRFRICFFAIAFSCYRTFNHRPKKKKWLGRPAHNATPRRCGRRRLRPKINLKLFGPESDAVFHILALSNNKRGRCFQLPNRSRDLWFLPPFLLFEKKKKEPFGGCLFRGPRRIIPAANYQTQYNTNCISPAGTAAAAAAAAPPFSCCSQLEMTENRSRYGVSSSRRRRQVYN